MTAIRTAPTRELMRGTVDAYLAFRHDLRAALRRTSPAAVRAVFARCTDGDDPERRLVDGAPRRRARAGDPIDDPGRRRLADLHGAAHLWLTRHDAGTRAPAQHRVIAPSDRRRSTRTRAPSGDCERPGARGGAIARSAVRWFRPGTPDSSRSSSRPCRGPASELACHRRAATRASARPRRVYSTAVALGSARDPTRQSTRPGRPGSFAGPPARGAPSWSAACRPS